MKLMESNVLSTNLHAFLNLLHNLILEGWFTENVVRSNAGLTAVHVLPPGYTSVGEGRKTQNSHGSQSTIHLLCNFALFEYFATTMYS